MLLTVGCGIALQLSLIRLAVVLGYGEAAFPVLAAHIAGWGAGLGLVRAAPGRTPDPALLAACAALLAWLGTAAATSPELPFAAPLGTTPLVIIALASGLLAGCSIAAALAGCGDPMIALAGDLGGVGLGAASHVLLTAWQPAAPAALPWVALLALHTVRRSPARALAVALAATGLLLPLERPSALAGAETPLGRALRERGLDAWRGSFHDLEGRVDVVAEGTGRGVGLYINGGTQAQTPRDTVDGTTAGLLDLLRPRSALVLGAGGMVDVAALLEGGVERVAAVERSDAVLRAAKASAPAARRVIDDVRVDVIRAEGRRFVSAGPGSFDLVLLPLAYASAGASPAALTLYPNFLFTVEGIRSLGEVVSPLGAVCFVVPMVELRDRILSSLGRIEGTAAQRRTLGERLWVAQSRRASAYSEAVCWAPHAPLAARSSQGGLVVLHQPGEPASRPLLDRLDGVGTLAPAADWRPYFFDLFTLHSTRARIAPFVRDLLVWTVIAIVLTIVALCRRGGGNAPPRWALAIAWLTGFAFPAVEYVVLSIARASGFSEGAAYALAAIVFALSGLLAMVPRVSLRGRALVGCASLAGVTAFVALGGVSWLIALPSGLAAACGLALMLWTLATGMSTFVGLFRMERTRSPEGADVRQFFVASALGTLAGTGPVLAIELRWGGVGSATLAAVVYLVASAVAAREGR